ncbi:metal homeostatis protein bsd2 [Emericellopsis atlantica]|uniref:Metal homeostatis protein bsd2 n=1 Tax=Emericellopsis atlantica TaxID=2614577 RepID=A0A9P7ZHD1_9HYPO|nr:metal homeostatis protein bsd2 [Emericellopsis atlantica]KAG9252143.1 metal homeostatis protein bsd2 [Emericellopsis atlantica]
MAGGYERVNAHDEEDHGLSQPTPFSPPPSFHSRSSSPNSRRHQQVDSTLADAFDDDDDNTDDESDDRQRLVRQNSMPNNAGASSPAVAQPSHHFANPNADNVQRTTRVMGGGNATDGVFANMSARPERQDAEKEEQPPTYEQAAADAVPPYWETTIFAPGLGGADEVYVDGLPVGSVFSFIWNGMISTSFQLVGFLLTYLLHSTHAAKNGSRAGLGITLIQYGFYMKAAPVGDAPSNMGGQDGYAAPPDPNSHDFDEHEVTDGGDSLDFSGGDWLAYVLMIVGWFILIKSTVEYLKARRHEQLVLQTHDRGLGVPVIAQDETPDRVV